MIIDNLKSGNQNSRKRISAKVRWEDCDRAPYDLYFETAENHAQGFSCNPHAFLIASVIPAMHYGEQRVSIGEEICPELLEGLSDVMRFFRYWYYRPEKELVRIESKVMPPKTVPNGRRRAGSFFSGGIDSFGTICANRMNYPTDHPRRIKDAFIVHGLEQDDPEKFDYLLNSLKTFEDHDDFTIIPVYTNAYLNFRDEDAANDFKFWRYEFGGAALASVAHAFSRRDFIVSIPSSSHLYEMEPWGTHPLVDAHFSSGDMRVVHDGLTLTRLDKIKLVADWDLALKHLRVCNRYKQYQEGRFNCGRCEKCVRTMLGLLAVGALNKTDAFPVKDVSCELVQACSNKLHNLSLLKPVYQEIIPELERQNRHDLAAAVRKMLDPPKKHVWKKKIAQFDKKFLNSELANLKKSIPLKGHKGPDGN